MNLKKEAKRLARRYSIPYFEINKSYQEDKKCLECIDKNSIKLDLPEMLDSIDDERTLYFIPRAKVLSRRDNLTATGEEKVIKLALSDSEKVKYCKQINYNYREKGLGAYFETI
jgi:hypothetical protein